jgi:hypothetical protein
LGLVLKQVCVRVQRLPIKAIIQPEKNLRKCFLCESRIWQKGGFYICTVSIYKKNSCKYVLTLLIYFEAFVYHVSEVNSPYPLISHKIKPLHNTFDTYIIIQEFNPVLDKGLLYYISCKSVTVKSLEYYTGFYYVEMELLISHVKYFTCISVYHMKSTGWVNISNEDCKELHYKFQEEKGNFQ